MSLRVCCAALLALLALEQVQASEFLALRGPRHHKGHKGHHAKSLKASHVVEEDSSEDQGEFAEQAKASEAEQEAEQERLQQEAYDRLLATEVSEEEMQAEMAAAGMSSGNDAIPYQNCGGSKEGAALAAIQKSPDFPGMVPQMLDVLYNIRKVWQLNLHSANTPSGYQSWTPQQVGYCCSMVGTIKNKLPVNLKLCKGVRQSCFTEFGDKVVGWAPKQMYCAFAQN